MRISLFSMGSRGDFQPYAALAWFLQKRGHQVRLLGNENFDGLARALGLDFVPLPIDSRTLTALPEIRKVILADDLFGFFRLMNRLGMEHSRDLDKILPPACADSDILVSSVVVEHMAVSLAQHLNIPLALSYLAPVAPTSREVPFAFLKSRPNWGPLNAPLHALAQAGYWQLIKGSVEPHRRAWGLSAGNPLSLSRRATLPALHGYSPSLCGIPGDWDPARQPVCGAWSLPPEAAQALPGDHQDPGFAQWLENGSPPVFFGFGSMPAMEPLELLELVGQACEDMEVRGVLAPGWSGEIQGLADCELPEGLALAGECDQAWLFSHCAAVLHHGGAGTTHTASAVGVPQIVCPLFADQPFWARAVSRQGAGLALPFKALTPDSLRRALAEVLSPERADAAAQLGARMGEEKGLLRAAEALETWG